MGPKADQITEFDHSFKAVHDDEINWEDGIDNDILTFQKQHLIQKIHQGL